MQPYALLFSFILLPFFKVQFTKSQLCVLVLTVSGVLLFLISKPSFTTFRSLFNYISLFFIYYITFKILKSGLIDFSLLIKKFFFIWILVGVVQVVYKKDFLTFLISDSRTTENRGVTSLAPEPTFFAIILLFFLIYFLQMNLKRKSFYIALIVFSIIFIAKSSMGLLYLIVLFIFLFFAKINFKSILLAFLISTIAFFAIPIISDSRIYSLIYIFIDNPANLLLLDASINDRFFQIFFAFKGFFDFYLLPHGFSSWNSYVINELPKFSNYVIVDHFSAGGRILSAYGSLFFELGFLGFILPFIIFYKLYYLYRDNLKFFFMIFILINLLLLSAIPIGFSYFGFYLGFLDYLVLRKKMKFEEVVLTNS